MRIVVTIANSDPPEGHVTSSQYDAPTAFAGWLGLIRVLADAFASDVERDGGAPGPRRDGPTD